MIGALWTGISGLSSHQKALDNESNNIANVNTVGFKSSRISFADQMYQSKIGKGSIVQDAEKLYIQGNTKITGVEFDMMLEGDGFFTVVNKNTLGTAESFYTRAGNFRMGDNGTLQDSGGNEVQGWIMSPIDAQKDVTSTNPNTSVFTNDYTKMVGSKVIRHGNYVETVTSKATDYNSTAKSDSVSIFSGDGAKGKSAKVSDIEAATKDYNNWLQKLKEEPDGPSSPSLPQISQIDFKSGADSIIGKDGDKIHVVIDGQTISTNYIVTNSTQSFRKELWDGLSPAERTSEGLVNPTGALTPSQIEVYDKAAGKIATYKSLSDLISNRLPVEATMVIDGGKTGEFNINETYKNSTKIGDMLKGIIQIKSLIPGQEFKITEVVEQSGAKIVQGNYQSTGLATKGAGLAAVQSAKDALARLITGKQQDVYTPVDLSIANSPTFQYNITIYDKELGMNVPIPNDNGKPPVAVPVLISGAHSVDDIAAQINANEELTKHIEARNVNGNLIVQTRNENYDVEFTGNVKQLPSLRIDLNEAVDNSDYSFTVNVNGAPNVFQVLATTNETLTQAQIYESIKTQIDGYNAIPSNVNKIIATPLNSEGRFSIYAKDEGVSFDGSRVVISNDNPATQSAPVVGGYTPTALQINKITLAPVGAGPTTYTLNVMGQSFSVTAELPAVHASIHASLKAQIEAAFVGVVEVRDLSVDSFEIVQLKTTSANNGLGNTNLGTSGVISSSDTTTYAPGSPQVNQFGVTFPAGTSSSVFTLTLGDATLKVKTSQLSSPAELNNLLKAELAKNPALAEKFGIDLDVIDPTKINVTQKPGPKGYEMPSAVGLAITSLTATGDEFETATVTANEVGQIEVNKNYSGREGAGAEFLEIRTVVDQTASKGSIQLRLDTLNISDSPFGEFSVDSTGLITMKQDGAEFAIGQVAIARFNNNRGLSPEGNNLFGKTSDSGDPIYNVNNNKTAEIRGKALELSNSDLSESLVNLMIFQRAFEANAKSITTADELLNTLINLKR